MPIAQEVDVDQILKPYYRDMSSILVAALGDWRSGPYAATMQDPKVRAIVVWNQFLTRAKATFEGREGIRVESIKQWQGLLVGDRFFIRMKKCGPKLLSSNYPTRSALDCNDASKDLFEGVIPLELLYSLDPLGTEISRIVIGQRHRNKVLWAIDLLDLADNSAQIVIPMQKPSPGGSPAERMIKPKKVDVKIQKDGTRNGT